MEKERQGVNLGRKGPAFEKRVEKKSLLQKGGEKVGAKQKGGALFAKKGSPTQKCAFLSSLSTFLPAHSLSCPSLYKNKPCAHFSSLVEEEGDATPLLHQFSTKFQHRVSFHSHLHLPEALLRPVYEFYVYEGAVEGNFYSV